MCHEISFVDFTQINSALIVGKIDNNDLYSNGVGKTTIFKSLEYVLFNQADVNLEKIIRDDAPLCQIVLDFMIDDQIYRLSRSRTKKGVTDITLLVRNNIEGSNEEVYHTLKLESIYEPILDDTSIKKYWKDLSCRRAADTEKEINKLIKTNYKAFRSTLHFIQNDFTGLSTATPDKRKGILREALSLNIYSKLEKLAKEQSNIISKEIDKYNVLITNLGNPEESLNTLLYQIKSVDIQINSTQNLLSLILEKQEDRNSKLNELKNNHSLLESKFSYLVMRDKVLADEKRKLEYSIQEYQTKKTNLVKSAQLLVNNVSELKDTQSKLLEETDFSILDSITTDIVETQRNIIKEEEVIRNNNLKYNDLKIPIPDDSYCKYCRQPLTTEHKLLCKSQVEQELVQCQDKVKISKQNIVVLKDTLNKQTNILKLLQTTRQQLDNIDNAITNKSKEIQEKKVLNIEYKQLLSQFIQDLELKDKEITNVKNELLESSLEEANNIKKQIEVIKNELFEINKEISTLNRELSLLTSNKAVIQNNIDQKHKDIIRLKELKDNLLIQENKITLYPQVIQAFSSTGIPNLIIQTVLDDLQTEANLLLNQLKPGLQLYFIIEKTKVDGTQDDTLEINYQVNGKNRDYDQLSGAMKLAVTFSLKLGLSFLLQKMMGTDIRLLLLDEIDQSLDKAGVDAFADIVKYFQNEFKILVITHNDRLKDKFSHAILVNQDINMISRAQVVSSW
jgi:DNA repair exonuclease SbcCD ATPase subunit